MRSGFVYRLFLLCICHISVGTQVSDASLPTWCNRYAMPRQISKPLKSRKRECYDTSHHNRAPRHGAIVRLAVMLNTPRHDRETRYVVIRFLIKALSVLCNRIFNTVSNEPFAAAPVSRFARFNFVDITKN